MKIAIFYHTLFFMGTPPELRPMAVDIVSEQITQMEKAGLVSAADEMIVGINGGQESEDIASVLLPKKAKLVFHGLQSRAENPTIVLLENWAEVHPGWAILYLHAKGSSHEHGSPYGQNVSGPWRRAMMADLVENWRACVADLEAGAEMVCSHFMRNMADGTQHIPAGNFLWTTANFVRTLPSIFMRERIKVSGIDALESRFEAEVYWGNGPRLPMVKEWRPNGGGGCP
jgi:hypothetical protein